MPDDWFHPLSRSAKRRAPAAPRRPGHVLALLASLLLWNSIAAAQENSPAPRPNIVFLLADDLGSHDVGWRGGEIKTPQLDKLARAGARLEQFYVQPVCSPTRAALMTGRYPFRHGLQVGVVRPWAQYGLPLEERTLPQALREAGYQTAIVGKWHLGHFERDYLPTRRGFDRQYGHYNGALDYFKHDRDGGFDWHRDDRECHDEGYTTHLIAREVVRIIKERDPTKPLFLYVPFNTVHAPHQVPEKYTEPYGHLQGNRRVYAGMLAALDEAVGQIAEAIDGQGLTAKTLFIFSSDNGGPAPGRVTSNGPLRAGKGTLYEGGVRVCAFASWKGHIQHDTAVNVPLHIVDWYPTLLKLAGAPLEQKLPLDGRDLWPALTAGQPSPHEEIVLNAAPRTGAIRAGDWKLVLNGSADAAEGENAEPAPPAGKKARKKAVAEESVELFNLADDPREERNVAAQNAERVRDLRARYAACARQAVPPKARPKSPDFQIPRVWGE
ncbi:MAG: arylsulfatase [Planctomycetia bacterium]|nr:arylsulfatase [Planctomycetia bacterium]